MKFYMKIVGIQHDLGQAQVAPFRVLGVEKRFVCIVQTGGCWKGLLFFFLDFLDLLLSFFLVVWGDLSTVLLFFLFLFFALRLAIYETPVLSLFLFSLSLKNLVSCNVLLLSKGLCLNQSVWGSFMTLLVILLNLSLRIFIRRHQSV